jgi:copper chaperone NosL
MMKRMGAVGFFFFGSLRIFTAGLLLFATIFFCSCGQKPVQPVQIEANDICFHCKSPVSDVAFSAEFITKDGEVRKFDDIGCLIASARKTGRNNIRVFFARDIMSRSWFPAEQLQFVRSATIPTPHKTGLIAFKDAAKARQIASRYQAELTRLEDMLK